MHGIDIPVSGAPRQSIDAGPDIFSVALSTQGFVGNRFDMLVEPGTDVALGQPIFCDRTHREIVFTSPASGTVRDIHFGARRRLDSVVIACEANRVIAIDTEQKVRSVLLVSGLWTAFRARPFGHIPVPDAQAEAILVTAMETDPLSPDAAVIINASAAEFAEGLAKLTELTPAKVIVCHAAGASLPAVHHERVRFASFAGKHPAGLPGMHLDRLELSGKPIWQIDYQDVIAIGHLFQTGQCSNDRVVSVAGPMAKNPRLIQTQRGACLDDLLCNERSTGPTFALAGSILTGRRARFLGHRDTQVCLLPAPPQKQKPNWFSQLIAGARAPIVPSETLDSALSQNILPVPLMRALSVGDWVSAQKLGCLNLLEEDVALLSYLCTSGTDYGVLLRSALDDFSKGMR